MKRLVLTGGLALCIATALAMPSKKELSKAQPLVNELMESVVNDFKAKKKTAKDVAEMAEKLAGEAEGEAAKFLLLKGAVTYYSWAGEYDKAADSIETLLSGVEDVPPEVLVEIISRATSRIGKENAPRLYAQYRVARAKVKAQKGLKTLEAALKKRPGNVELRREYAELHAVSGDWKAALAEFAKLKDKTAEIAKAEADGKAKASQLADFWWDYKAQSEEVDEAIKAHAAALYKKAIGADELSGLKKTLAEQRIEEVGVTAVAAAVVEVVAEESVKGVAKSAFQIKGNEATLDLGEKYGKLEFVKCPAGTVKVIENKHGKTRNVKISRDFWIMKAPTTALQNSVAPSLGEWGGLSRDMVDGLTDYLSSYFEEDLPKGMVVRLPTIAEWEYAYHANTKDKNDPFYDLANVGSAKKWHKIMTTKQSNGKTRENKWGLYNFATWERVLDKFPREVFASQGWDPVKNDRKQKGGWFQARECPLPENDVDTFSWSEDKEALIACRSAQWTGWFVDKYTDNDWGAVNRLVIGPDLVKEWKEREAKK